MTIRLVGADLFHVERRTDMTKLIVAFRSFANLLTKSLEMNKFSVPYNSFRLLIVFKKCSWILS